MLYSHTSRVTWTEVRYHPVPRRRYIAPASRAPTASVVPTTVGLPSREEDAPGCDADSSAAFEVQLARPPDAAPPADTAPPAAQPPRRPPDHYTMSPSPGTARGKLTAASGVLAGVLYPAAARLCARQNLIPAARLTLSARPGRGTCRVGNTPRHCTH